MRAPGAAALALDDVSGRNFAYIYALPVQSRPIILLIQIAFSNSLPMAADVTILDLRRKRKKRSCIGHDKVASGCNHL